MINFIQEYWWQIAIYLIGCVLAKLMINARNYTESIKSSFTQGISDGCGVAISWIAVLFLLLTHRKGRMFKWLPILLLWCMSGCIGNSIASNSDGANTERASTPYKVPYGKDAIGYMRVDVIVIDHCEYLILSGSNITHKGNCNNPTHR